MKVYISADLEGVNGVLHSSQTQPQEPSYAEAVSMLHKELSALVDGLRDSGSVSEIFVSDAHWDARNLNLAKLPRGVNLISGWQRPYSMLCGISGKIGAKQIVDQGFDGVFFLGYHTRAGDASGVLSHTYRARVFQDVKLNGVSVGECGLNAALAGYFGVPVAFISGDDATCNEARNLLGSLTCVTVKKAISRYSAVCLPETESLEALRRGAQDAVSKRDYWSVFCPPRPSSLTLSFQNPSLADAAELLPEVKRLDDRSVELKHDDYSVLFRLFLATGVLAAGRLDPYF